jgi:hypothetical protein
MYMNLPVFKVYLWLAWVIVPCISYAKAIPFVLDSSGRHELEIELDPYYSALDYIVSLTTDPIPRLPKSAEEDIYRFLGQALLNPRTVLMEVSFNPLPFAGVMIREHAKSVYRGADYNGTNILGALTEGFPEPWAFSLFWGGVVNFYHPELPEVQTGRGYSGFLISGGNYHILRNHWYPDKWMELETKVKGSDITPDRNLSWSFRVGTKLHGNSEVASTMYVAIKRDRADFVPPGPFSFIDIFVRNSEIEFRTDMSYQGQFTHLMVLAGKKWPFKEGKLIASLGIGAQKRMGNSYSGSLKPLADEAGWSIMLRPNILF